jgi:hypothetical protein
MDERQQGTYKIDRARPYLGVGPDLGMAAADAPAVWPNGLAASRPRRRHLSALHSRSPWMERYLDVVRRHRGGCLRHAGVGATQVWGELAGPPWRCAACAAARCCASSTPAPGAPHAAPHPWATSSHALFECTRYAPELAAHGGPILHMGAAATRDLAVAAFRKRLHGAGLGDWRRRRLMEHPAA